VKEYLYSIFEKIQLDYFDITKLVFNVPNYEEQGDFSTNIAFVLAKQAKKNPKLIAEEIVNNLNYDKNIINKIEIAGNGFINIFINKEAFGLIVKDILEYENKYQKIEKYKGKKAQVEFVSANPTGPLTVGHGRNSVVGDTIAKMLEYIGYDVNREYYFNNAGRQMRVLGESVRLRYKELCGETIVFPEDYYQGEYIKDIAKILYDKYSSALLNEEKVDIFKDTAEKVIFEDIKKTLKRINIVHDTFFNENNLYETGKIDELLKIFSEKNVSYEKDGAIWLKLTELGNEQDKVIVKSTGEPTYRLPDIAYHKTKFERGFDLIVDIFGSDHKDTVPDVLAALKFLGFDISKVVVLLHQFVTITQNGEIVKMSTRKANYVTLDELIDEVGPDVVRYFFIMRSITSHLNFDIELAKKQTDENPVFYLQYAHARISSIYRMCQEQNINPSTQNLNLLKHKAELNLLKIMHKFRDEMIYACEHYEPHRIANYLIELSGAFHSFYAECRIIGSEYNLSEARLALSLAVQKLLRIGLTILGINAPDKM